MTWSKTQQGTEYMPGFDTINYKDAIDEALGWLTTRGWTLEFGPNNSASESFNYWKFEKTINTWDGVPMICRELIRVYASVSTPANMQIMQFNLNANPEGYWPASSSETGITGTGSTNISHQGYFEMWESDLDSDSFLIVSRSDGGDVKGFAFQPPSNTRMKYDAETGSTTKCPLKAWAPVVLDRDDPLMVGTGTSSEYMEFDSSKDSTYHTTSTDPVVEMGFSRVAHAASGGPTIWRSNAADMGLATVRSNTQSVQFHAVSSSDYNTLQIGSNYYIRLGSLPGSTTLLLDCGTTNPSF